MMSVSAGFAGGWLTSSLIWGDKRDKSRDAYVYIGCGVVFLAGLPLHIVGVKKINKAIADYNTRHGFAAKAPEISLGAQQYGVGLALKF